MDQKKPEEAESSTSRRQFLQRSPVVLLPYVAPVIASMAIHVKNAEAKRSSRFSRFMAMSAAMSSASSPSSPSS
jgi:hypothetical protein